MLKIQAFSAIIHIGIRSLLTHSEGSNAMRCKRTPLEAEVLKYELGKGLEDGFELLSDVITKQWFVTAKLIQTTREDGSIVCPYISHRRGKTFIGEGDYIILDDDGTKHVCGGDKIFQRYEEVK